MSGLMLSSIFLALGVWLMTCVLFAVFIPMKSTMRQHRCSCIVGLDVVDGLLSVLGQPTDWEVKTRISQHTLYCSLVLQVEPVHSCGQVGFYQAFIREYVFVRVATRCFTSAIQPVDLVKMAGDYSILSTVSILCVLPKLKTQKLRHELASMKWRFECRQVFQT